MNDQKDDKEINATDHQNDEIDDVLSADDLDDLDMLLDELDQTENRDLESDPDLSLSQAPEEQKNSATEDEGDIFDALDELTLDDFSDESEDPEVDPVSPGGKTEKQNETIESVTAEEPEGTAAHDTVEAAATATDDVDESGNDTVEQETQNRRATDTSELHQTLHEEDDEDALSELFGDKPNDVTDQQHEDLPLQDDLSESLDDVLDEPEVIDPSELADLPLDEMDASSVNSVDNNADDLEKDIENLLDSNRDTREKTSSETIDSTQRETDMSDNSQQSETKGSAAKKPRFNFNMANSITMSLGLIAVLVAALALWFGLDASQQTDSLKAEPQKMQKQVDQMQERLDVMQQQLDGLTQVVANKSTENWQKSDPAITPSSESPMPMKVTTTSTKAAQHASSVKDEPTARLAPSRQKPAVANKPAPAITKRSPPAKRQFNSPYEVARGSVKGWAVNMMSYETARAAEQEVRRLRTKGVKAEFVQVIIKGKIWFRVRVSGFHTEREAVAYEKYMTEFQAIDVWHHKLR